MPATYVTGVDANITNVHGRHAVPDKNLLAPQPVRPTHGPESPKDKADKATKHAMANLSEEEKRMLEERMNVKYRARTSILDFSLAHENQFRGFFMLFWICLGAKVLDNFMVSFTRDGKILSLSLASLMTRDLLTLGLSDLVLVGQTLFCVPLVYLLYRSGMKMNPIVIMIQFVWYVTILVCVCVWVRIRYVYRKLT